MNWPRRNRPDHAADKPDVERARAELDRIRAQRRDVQELVDALVRERKLNHFTANAQIVFRGGR